MARLVSELAAGACFGVALLLSGLYAPMVITSQMQLRNHHMLETYAIAGALSSILVSVANARGYLPVNIRTPKTIGLIPFDANIIGGALQGIGMAITASCPATVFVQVALGMTSGYYTLLGCVLGGIAYVLLAPHLQRVSFKLENAHQKGRSQAHTLHETLGWRQDFGALVFASLSVVIVCAFDSWIAKSGHEFGNPIYSGYLIGLAQAAIMLLVRRTVGVSTSFEDIGKALTTIRSREASNSFFTSSTKFACGIVVGSLAFARLGAFGVPISVSEEPQLLPIPSLLAGGAAMIFGARLAGGCTSGHGISGVATLSLSSFVTVGAMYAGGAVATILL